jgi:hypothetical protein
LLDSGNKLAISYEIANWKTFVGSGIAEDNREKIGIFFLVLERLACLMG